MNRSYPGLSCPHGIRWRSIGDGKRFIVELGGSQMAVVVSAPGLVSEPFFGTRLEANTVEFWFVMQLAMLAGFANLPSKLVAFAKRASERM